jgi:hypothetical protein
MNVEQSEYRPKSSPTMTKVFCGAQCFFIRSYLTGEKTRRDLYFLKTCRGFSHLLAGWPTATSFPAISNEVTSSYPPFIPDRRTRVDSTTAHQRRS